MSYHYGCLGFCTNMKTHFKLISLLFLLVVGVQAQTPFEYLNQHREDAGMIPFSQNSYLDTSAYNHASYMMLNMDIGHVEDSSKPEFTGINPWDRAHAVGYKASASENLTAGYFSYDISIDGLFTAIYHRFGFLSFGIDEIGIGMDVSSDSTVEARVYNMGDSNIVELCDGTSFDGFGSYYHGICADETFRIEVSDYDDAKNINKQLNPDIVTWPYENQDDFQPVFFEESPDPMPTCSVTGNPISIEFNDLKTGDIQVSSFKLFNSSNIEITDTTLLNQQTDPNSRFSDKQFALFPMKRLDWNSVHRATVMYAEGGTNKNKTWYFKTKKIGYPYYIADSDNQTFLVKSGITYAIYVPPVDCNDSRYDYSYSYSQTLTINTNDAIDANTLLFNLDGNNGDVLNLTLAMAIGDEFDIKKLLPFDFAELCDTLEIKLSLLLRSFHNISRKIVNALNDSIVIDECMSIDPEFVEKYSKNIFERIERLSNVIKGSGESFTDHFK